ncbi:L-rhamnose mutarotase [Pectinatus haikarae]|uniref:L-rhamnose mutarotase n=1 Tax=Pectinatus haikarae TaxID=349096 RepID=UPI0018C733B1|nr:L-rhamnose mutarotase [Pectinatus haikarae]
MLEIVDSHFHIWDLNVLNLPWLEAYPSLKKNYTMDNLCKIYGSHDVLFKGGVYVEVDCDNTAKEDEFIFNLNHPLILAKIMRAQLCKSMRLPLGVAGVREPLHTVQSPRGRCLKKDFIEGLEILADNDLIFESCNRVEELTDLHKALSSVPQVKAVINHCGNITEFNTDYQQIMKKLASLPNVYCKVSGFPTGDTVFLKKLLDFLTSIFRTSRLLYASNFPVISLYSSFDEHLNTLRKYFNDNADFFSKNAKKLYKINKPQIRASVIRLRTEKASYYKKLHASPYPSVNEMIRQCGINQYKIFNRDDLLFSIMEYCGDDYEYDMEKMAHDPETIQWWKETDPCQTRIEGAAKDEWWADMQPVYDLNKKIPKGD